MNLPQQLHRLFSDRESTDDNDDKSLCLPLRRWNDSVEAFFNNPRLDDSSISDDPSETILQESVSLLQSRLLSTVVDSCSQSAKKSDISPDFVAAIDSDDAADVASKKAASISRQQFESIEDENQLRLISQFLRASKNMLRLHMQVLVPQQLASQQTTQRLSSNGMLELYVTILQTKQLDPARHASLSLFYSVYNHMNDETILKRETYLIDKLDFLTVSMDMILQSRPTSFVLTMVRHVHNLVASVPDTSQQIDVILMQLSANRTEKYNAPWSHENWDSLSQILVCIADWCLMPNPTFPGSASDRRADLVLECLRVLFVLRAGTAIMEASEEEESSLKKLVHTMLGLSDNDDRSYACKLATVSLLMDAPSGFSDYLVSSDSIGALLRILELQISAVVDRCIYGNQAATELTPILVVLNNFSAANSTVLQTVKDRIFPPENQDEFQKKAAVEMSKSTNKNGIGAKNMAPLDAPKGTLRWKMIRLMTWTESHTKRLTSELLWTLCGGNAQEFVLRTGFGNAMPLLACKGLVQMPVGMSR